MTEFITDCQDCGAPTMMPGPHHLKGCALYKSATETDLETDKEIANQPGSNEEK